MSDRRLGDGSIATGQQILDQDKGINTDPYQTSQPAEKTIDEAELANYILACKKEAEESQKTLRLTWGDLWDSYTCTGDFSKKEDWQSKIFIPEVKPAIKKATSLITRILNKNDNNFTLDPGLIQDENLPSPGQIENPYIAGQKAAIQYWLAEANWDQLFREWVESAFTFGISYLKFWWEPKEKMRIAGKQQDVINEVMHPMGFPVLQRSRETYFERETYLSSSLAGKVIDPMSIYTDPDHTYYIEETMTTLDEVMRLAEGGLFDPAAVEKMKGQDYAESREESDRLKRLKLDSHSNPFRKRVKLQTFWGHLLDREGVCYEKNAQVILANELHILNPNNIQNPFWHMKPPYLELAPIKMLYRKEGKGIAEDSMTIQRSINDMVMMLLDGLLFKLAKMFQGDPERLRVPEQLKTVKPGMFILTKGSEQVVREVQVSDVPQGAMNELEVLRRAIQNDTGVNDFLLGGQQNQVDTTATEASIRSAESNALFEDMSRTIEDGVEKAIMMVQSLILQYWDDFNDPALQEMARRYGLPFGSGSREMKLLWMQPNMKVKVRGISGYFQRAEDLQKYVKFLEVAGKIPQIAMRLELREILDRIVRAFDFSDPDKLVIPPQLEMMIKQAETMQLVAQTMPAMMPPGGPPPPQGPGGPGGPPPPQQLPPGPPPGGPMGPGGPM